jgi:hypothetical protein
MVLLDEQEQRWYCDKGDEVYLAKEDLWGHETPPHLDTNLS